MAKFSQYSREDELRTAMEAVLVDYPDIELTSNRVTGGDYIEVYVRKRGATKTHRMKLANTLLATASAQEIALQVRYFLSQTFNVNKPNRPIPKEEKIKQPKPSVKADTGNSWADEWIRKNNV